MINKTDGPKRQQYKGQRYYTRKEKDEIFDILDSFNPRTLIEKPPPRTNGKKKVEETKKATKIQAKVNKKVKKTKKAPKIQV